MYAIHHCVMHHIVSFQTNPPATLFGRIHTYIIFEIDRCWSLRAFGKQHSLCLEGQKLVTLYHGALTHLVDYI
jgi:hypothetical protein